MRNIEYVTEYHCKEHHNEAWLITEPCEPADRAEREAKMICAQCGAKPRAFDRFKRPR